VRLPTASRLDLFRSCAGPWYLPLPEKREESSKAAEKGRSLHKFAETGEAQGARGKVTLAEEAVRRALEDLPEWVAIHDVPARECVVRYNPFTGVVEIVGRSDKARPYGDSDSEWIWGTADLVGSTEGEVGTRLLLADLKTGSAAWLKPPWGTTGSHLDAPLQTLFLAACFNRVLHLPGALVAIVSSACERAYSRYLSAGELDDVLLLVSEMVAHPPTKLNPSEHCTFCPVRGVCPCWSTTK
jgi:hypothetical protein